MSASPKSWTLLWLLVAATQCSIRATAKAADDLDVLDKVGGRMTDETIGLSEDELGSIITNFGHELGSVIDGELKSLLETVEKDAGEGGEIGRGELELLRRAGKELSESAEERIALVGSTNEGQLTQSWASKSGRDSALSLVSRQLQSAGGFIKNRMDTVGNFYALKVRGKFSKVPARLQKLMHWPSFLSFKIKFAKVYKSLKEEIYRQMLFMRTQAIVGIHNVKYLLGKRTHLLRATQFADWTGKEYQETYDNKLAENNKLSDAPKEAGLGDKERRELERLAAQNRNIFGQDMQSVLDESRMKSSAGRAKQRPKRSADEDDEMFDAVEHRNELDESEDDDDESFEDALDDEIENELADDVADAMIVDEYAAKANGVSQSDIDDLESIMDEALADEGSNFKPVDLRTTNCIQEPENQYKCGCCYAYVVTTVATFYNCIVSPERRTKRLNTRFLSDCGRYLQPEGVRPAVNGCSGGRLSQAVNFARQAGFHAFMPYALARMSFNWNFEVDTCAYPRPADINNWAPIQVPFLKGARFVTIKMEEVNLHLRTIGPVFVNIRSWAHFEQQGGGIHDKFDESPNPIIHSMLIIGHDKDQLGRDYFILWNSHGVAWGEDGFVRIYRDSLEHYTVYLAGLMPILETTE